MCLKENSLRKRSFIHSSLNHLRSDLQEKYRQKKPFIESMGLTLFPIGLHLFRGNNPPSKNATNVVLDQKCRFRLVVNFDKNFPTGSPTKLPQLSTGSFDCHKKSQETREAQFQGFSRRFHFSILKKKSDNTLPALSRRYCCKWR